MKNLIIIALASLFVFSCKPKDKSQEDGTALSPVAQSKRQWTGIAISQNGRLFVNYPNWSSDVPISVAELNNGKISAYPNLDWNLRKDSLSFIAVQSVYIDNKDRLWVLDTNNPRFGGVKDKGPILYQFNLDKDTLVASYYFSADCYKPNSYFNDFRIDTEDETAYITDSGDGALIVLDLNSGKARRLLDDHPSTKCETNQLFCDGIKWENSVHSDGIALNPNRDYLYYIALSGHTLYRIKTSALRNTNLSTEALEKEIEKVSTVPATDGMLFDKQGNLYMGGLEDNSINRLNVDGSLTKLVKDPAIRWADSFTQDAKGIIYFTTSQIYIPEEKRIEYEVLSFDPSAITD